MTGIAQAFFMGYGQGGAWTPASLFASSEVGAWYDPSDLTTMWTDDGVTQAGVNDAIYRIDDKSGNGFHAIQSTLAARPVLRESGGLYYLEFDGTDDVLTAAVTDMDDCDFVGGLMRSGAPGVIATAAVTKFIGYYADGITSAPDLNSGNPLYRINGVEVSGGTSATRNDLHDAWVDSSPSVVVADGVSTSASSWFSNGGIKFPFYSGAAGTRRVYQYIVRSALSSEDLSLAESYVAGKTGVTL